MSNLALTVTAQPVARSVRDPLLEKDLPAKARRQLDYWRDLLRPAMQQKARGVEATLKQIAKAAGQPFRTVRNRYYRWRRDGVMGLIDKSVAGRRFWVRRARPIAPEVSLSRGLQDLWRALCEENKRRSKPEYKKLVAMWSKRDPRIAAIPEYADFPGWPALPPGWSYPNLMRYGPSRFDSTVSRVGPFAAKKHRPTVFTTRAGLYVGSHLMLDDKWHDFFVNSFADKQAGRPLELYTFDLFSARKCRWGVRVRTKRPDGTYAGVPEEMTRWALASHLFQDGYSPRGTEIVAEHGTAAVADRIAEVLYNCTNGKITLSEAGMTGDPVLLGHYPGLRRGNPNHKAALESNNSREHNAFGSLPGQTGNSVTNRPEQLDGQLDNNAMLLAAYQQLPAETAALLEFSLLELNQFMSVADQTYAILERDRDHELEGWIESGNVTQLLEIGGKEILEIHLTPEQRAALPVMLESGFVQARPVRMSRREVWDRGASELLHLPGWGICEILGDDLARESTVLDGMFELQDQQIGPATYRYTSRVIDSMGRQQELRDGEKYQVFINPFALGTLFVRDAKGRYVGECRQIHAPCRGDLDAVKRAMGEAVKREHELLVPINARHDRENREKLRRHQANAAAMDDSTPAARAPSAAQKSRNQQRALQRLQQATTPTEL